MCYVFGYSAVGNGRAKKQSGSRIDRNADHGEKT